MSQRQDSTYFRHYGELDNPSQINGNQEFEFDTSKPLLDNNVSRRTFMTVLSASMAMAAASCRRPEHKLVAAIKPTEYQVAGLPNYYTSVYQHKNAAIGILVKAREGRPIKVDGNNKHSASLGSSSALLQGTLLSMYDPDRIRRPRVNGGDASYTNAAEKVAAAIKNASESGKKTAVLMDEHCSPSVSALIQKIAASNPGIQFYTLPAIQNNTALANEAVFGINAELVPDLSKADFILSVDNDFLGTDKHSIYYTRAFSANRKPTQENPVMNKLVAAESSFTLTGANADVRISLAPQAYEQFLSAILTEIASLKGKALPAGVKSVSADARQKEIARELASAANPVVLAGGHLPARTIALAQYINQLLDGVGQGKVWNAAYTLYNSADKTRSVENLRSMLASGQIGVVIYADVNPEYSADPELKKLLSEKVGFSASLSLHENETSEKLCKVSIPVSHYLESWGDAQSFDGSYSIQQPIIAPLNEGSGSIADTLMQIYSFIDPALFADTPTFYDFIRKQLPEINTRESWEALLRDGVIMRNQAMVTGAPTGLSALPSNALPAGIIAAIRPSYAFYDGQYSNNSWLQELPDPITKATWDNPALMNKKTAASLGVQQGEVVRISTSNGSVELPVFIQPGVADNVISLTIGYGRTSGGKVHNGVGDNVHRLADKTTNAYVAVKVEKAGRSQTIATTQGHHTIQRYDKPSPFDNEWRERTKDILGVEEGYVTFASLKQGGKSHHSSDKGHAPAEGHGGGGAHHLSDTLSIVDSYNYKGHRWAMAIDLSACTGCSACVVACQAENNIPNVGKKYVANSREMHWIRIDRYYREDEQGNVSTVFQPMLCQHCENAPCENVCPVAATTHSPEGLNEMTYNRCVGTRYCLNNCPYKVRRFNFLNWHKEDRTPMDMAFNPDVSVRMRGVMEKCTFCVQRLNEAKAHAKDQGRTRVHDGEAVTACQEACPANAILFGDINDAKSKVAMASMINRGNHQQNYKEANGAFKVLSEINVRPSVTYLVKVRNTNELPKV